MSVIQKATENEQNCECSHSKSHGFIQANNFFYLQPGIENSAGGIELVSVPRRRRRRAPLKISVAIDLGFRIEH